MSYQQILSSKYALTIFLAFLLPMAMLSPVNAHLYSVLQHVFAHGIDTTGTVAKPVGPAGSFTQNDAYVYAFTKASFSYDNFTWRWYDPSGTLYKTDSAIFSCDALYCELYDSLPISGTDAAAKLGTWHMDLVADGTVAYSDNFQLTAYVLYQESWAFNLTAPMHGHVSLDVTIHPYQEQWPDFSFNIAQDAGASNFTAYEYGTNKPLGVVQSTITDKQQIGVRVVFDSPKGEGYRFVILFDLGGSFGTISSDTFLDWTWNAGVNPLPMNVTVVLPPSFTLISVTGASNYNTGSMHSRTIVVFSGTAPPNGGFHWTVTYAPVVQSATLTTQPSTMSQAGNPLTSIPGFPVESIFLGVILAVAFLVARRLKIR